MNNELFSESLYKYSLQSTVSTNCFRNQRRSFNETSLHFEGVLGYNLYADLISRGISELLSLPTLMTKIKMENECIPNHRVAKKLNSAIPRCIIIKNQLFVKTSNKKTISYHTISMVCWEHENYEAYDTHNTTSLCQFQPSRSKNSHLMTGARKLEHLLWWSELNQWYQTMTEISS